MGSAWVGIDLGTQSVRVLAVADDGERIAASATPLVSRRDGARHEQDPEAWWIAVRDGLREVAAAVAASGASVAGIAASGTSGTVVPVDEAGRPVGPAVMYDDARGAGSLERVQEAGAALWDRLGYRMQGSWALPTILAMREEGTLPRGARIAHQPDVVLARLAGGRVATDASHALKTGVDLDRVAWPEDVLGALGLDAATLPEVVLPGAVSATVCAAAAEETGLPEGCPIVAGMTDGCAAQLAAGTLSPGDWNVVLGTTLVMKGVERRRTRDEGGAVYAHRAPFGLGWWPGGASSSGAGVLGQWLPGADLDALTGTARLLGRPPLAYPLVGRGERFPFVAADARPIRPEGSDAAVLAAVAVGVASIERLAFDLLAADGHDVSGTISATGGGARNRWWVELRAALLDRPLAVPRASEGALGMAMLAAAAIRDEPLPAVAARMLPAADVVEPADRPAWLLDAHVALVERWRDEGWLPSARLDVALAALHGTHAQGGTP